MNDISAQLRNEAAIRAAEDRWLDPDYSYYDESDDYEEEEENFDD